MDNTTLTISNAKLTKEILLNNGFVFLEESHIVHLEIQPGFANISVQLDDFSFAIYPSYNEFKVGNESTFETLETIGQLMCLMYGLTGKFQQFTI